jgi:hypothetical protein
MTDRDDVTSTWVDRAILRFEGLVHAIDGEVPADYLRCTNSICSAHRDIVDRLAGELMSMRRALFDLYSYMPRWACRSLEPDGCPVCVARAMLQRPVEDFWA